MDGQNVGAARGLMSGAAVSLLTVSRLIPDTLWDRGFPEPGRPTVLIAVPADHQLWREIAVIESVVAAVSGARAHSLASKVVTCGGQSADAWARQALLSEVAVLFSFGCDEIERLALKFNSPVFRLRVGGQPPVPAGLPNKAVVAGGGYGNVAELRDLTHDLLTAYWDDITCPRASVRVIPRRRQGQLQRWEQLTLAQQGQVAGNVGMTPRAVTDALMGDEGFAGLTGTALLGLTDQLAEWPVRLSLEQVEPLVSPVPDLLAVLDRDQLPAFREARRRYMWNDSQAERVLRAGISQLQDDARATAAGEPHRNPTLSRPHQWLAIFRGLGR